MVSLCSNASPYSATVTQAELALQGQHYALSAHINYTLSEKAKTALENGVPLYWTLRINLKQRRDLIWAKTLIEKHLRFRIEYHALLNMYRFCNQDSGDNQNFSTLSAAMETMSNIHNLQVIGQSQIHPDHAYYVELKIDFDSNALPLPLRPIAAVDPQWSLSSAWTLWPLKK
jgi:hypothetical protein